MTSRLDENEYKKYCDNCNLRFEYLEEIRNLIILIPYSGYIPSYDKKFVEAIHNIIENGYERIIINLLETPTTRIVIQLIYIELMMENYDKTIDVVVVTQNKGHESFYLDYRNQTGFSIKPTKVKWFNSISSAHDYFLNRL